MGNRTRILACGVALALGMGLLRHAPVAAQVVAPIWLDGAGRPSADADAALALLTGAAAEGLDPEDYLATRLGALASRLRAGVSDDSTRQAFDESLSRGLERYLRELHTGRVSPARLGFQVTSRAEEHDYASVVREAVRAHRVPEVADQFVPPLQTYRDLRAGLGRYRRIAADTSLVPPPVRATPVRPGEFYEGVGPLRRLLVALGDLSADVPEPAETSYSGALVEGVRRFQTRHGLTADGVLGRGTFAALRVPLDTRVRQIELSLERLRWLPHLEDGPLIGVNIPMFQLWAWDSAPRSPQPALAMEVIVGRALRTQTPVLVEEMDAVVFRPFWNVPASILRDEILPQLARNPAYLAAQDMEVVAGAGDSAPVVALSPEVIDRLSRGELRVRQRQGPKNALGLVKFVFPNDEDVYMHDTPAPELFSRDRRDFSHGCIRVEDPAGLATWVLQAQGWTREQVIDAMNAPRSRTVPIPRPVQVVLFYVTAAVVPGEGRMRFAADIYRHDAALDAALMARRR